jgi:hypothetical protein
VLGQRVTVFGDDHSLHRSLLRLDLLGRRAILPEDGRDWEDLEMRRQIRTLERDSVLQERIRATRARNEAERPRYPLMTAYVAALEHRCPSTK